MKFRYLLALIAMLFWAVSESAQAATWQLDPAHSSAQFAVRHMTISTVRGAFTKLSGRVEYDSTDLAKASVEVTIEANSVDTRNEKRDSDVKGPKLLDTATYPTITFKSRRVESAGAGKLKVTGDLTLRGVTKEVVLDVDGPTGPIKDPRGNEKMGASATTSLKRQDFGVSGFPSAMVGEDIAITLDVEMVNRAAPAQ